MVDAGESSEGIALASCVTLSVEEGGDQIRSVWDEGGRMLVNRGDGIDSIFPHIGMSMLEAGSRGG